MESGREGLWVLLMKNIHKIMVCGAGLWVLLMFEKIIIFVCGLGLWLGLWSVGFTVTQLWICASQN